MRWRFWRRRLGSGPRLVVRHAPPWPLRWLFTALVLGFSAALALWAFQVGKDIAGLDRNAAQEVVQLKGTVQALQEELDKTQTVTNTSGMLLTAEKAAQEQLLAQMRQLEADNQALRSELGFYEQLIPASGSDGLTIRGLQIDQLAAGQYKWQMVVIQALKDAPDFKGTLVIAFAGSLDGQPWTTNHTSEPQPVSIKGHVRLEGVVDLPAKAVVKTVTAKIQQSGAVKTMQVVQL